MNKYVVAFLSLGEGTLKQVQVFAHTRLDAYRPVLDDEFGGNFWKDYVSDSATTEDVEELVFDRDCYISALKISS